MPYRTEDGLFEIGLGHEEAPRMIFKVLCLKCGVRLLNESDGMLIHAKYHDEIDELVEWEQSVSQLFKRPSPDDIKGLPEPNAGHDGPVARGIKDKFNTGRSEEGLQKGSE